MNDIKKKIYVTHVNIRCSISLLLLKLVCIEIFAGILLALSQLAIYIYVTNAEIFRTIISFGIPVIMLLVTLKTFITVFVILQWLNEYYEISADLIKYRRGILFRKVDNYPTEDVKFIEVNQGFFGRLFNFGTITLMNIRRVVLVDMYLIHNPLRYAQVIEEVVPNLIERKRVMRKNFQLSNDSEERYLFGNDKSV